MRGDYLQYRDCYCEDHITNSLVSPVHPWGFHTVDLYPRLVLAAYLIRQALGNFRFVLSHKSERMSEVARTLSPNSSSYQADQFGALKQNTALGLGGAILCLSG
jgi:hypothetical protein